MSMQLICVDWATKLGSRSFSSFGVLAALSTRSIYPYLVPPCPLLLNICTSGSSCSPARYLSSEFVGVQAMRCKSVEAKPCPCEHCLVVRQLHRVGMHDLYRITLSDIKPDNSLPCCRPTTLFHTLHPTGPLSDNPPSHALTVHYLGPNLTPIECSGGLLITPNKTFSQVIEEDEVRVILLPGGQGARPGPGNEKAREFLKAIVPKVEYVLTGKRFNLVRNNPLSFDGR